MTFYVAAGGEWPGNVVKRREKIFGGKVSLMLNYHVSRDVEVLVGLA